MMSVWSRGTKLFNGEGDSGQCDVLPGESTSDSGCDFHSPVMGFVTLGKLLNLSVLPFLYLYNGDNNSSHFIGCYKDYIYRQNT